MTDNIISSGRCGILKEHYRYPGPQGPWVPSPRPSTENEEYKGRHRKED